VSGPEHEPSPDEVLDAIKRLRPSDLLLSTVTTLAQLAYAKLEEESRDLEQAKLAIDAIGAVLPLLEGQVPEDLLRDLGRMDANLKLAYAGAAKP
jgi:hypothetical protein